MADPNPQAPITKAGFLPRLFTAILPRIKPFSEMGVSGTPVYAGYVLTPERSPKLIGQEKYRTFAAMLANTSIVASGVRYFLNIVAKPSWSVEPADPQNDEAKKYAEFVEDVLYEDLHTPWSRIVRRCGTYRFHGFAIQEWVALRREDGKIGLHDIESRPQWTIWRWEVDERGTVIGAWQRDPLTGRELGLPRGKIIYLVDDTLTDSPEGMGLLRHCVEPVDRLEEYQKQEGFGFLRDLHGVPLGRAPMDELSQAVAAGRITQAQMDGAVNNLKSFVSMEKKDTNTAIILNSQPYLSYTESGNMVTSAMKWGVELLSGGAPGLQFVNEAIVRLNQELARILGVEHLLLGADAAGSFALAKEKATDLYLLANSVLRDIRLQMQHDVLWPLWSLNGFPDEMMPTLKTEDVAAKDVEQIARVMRDMATAGLTLQPDDEVQNFIRELLGAPLVDLDALRDRMEEMQQQQMEMGQQPGQPGAEGAAAQPGAGGQQNMQGMFSDFPDVSTPAAAEDEQDKKDKAQQKTTKKRLMDDELEKAGQWDESKHPRGQHGKFGAGSGGSTAGEKPAKTQGKGGSQEHANAQHEVASFMKDNASVVDDAVAEHLAEEGIKLGTSAALQQGMHMLYGRALGMMVGAAVGGGIPGAVVGFVSGQAASGLAASAVDTVAEKAGWHPKDAAKLIVRVGKSLYAKAKGAASSIGKAEKDKTDEKPEGDDKGKPEGDGQNRIADALKAFIEAVQAHADGGDDGEDQTDDEKDNQKDQSDDEDNQKDNHNSLVHILRGTDITKAGQWEESKHPRGEHGRFGSGGGGGKEEKNQPKQKEGGDVDVSGDAHKFMSDGAEGVAKAALQAGERYGLGFAITSAVSATYFKFFGQALIKGLGGGWGGIITDELIGSGAQYVTEKMLEKHHFESFSDAKDLAVKMTEGLIAHHKGKTQKADKEGKQPDKQAVMLKVAEALLAALKKLKEPKGSDKKTEDDKPKEVADKAEKALRYIDQQIAKSSNGNLPELLELREQLEKTWTDAARMAAAAARHAAAEWIKSDAAQKVIASVTDSKKAKSALVLILQSLHNAVAHMGTGDPMAEHIIQTHIEALANNLGVTKAKAQKMLLDAYKGLQRLRGGGVKKSADGIDQLFAEIIFKLDDEARLDRLTSFVEAEHAAD